MDKLSATIARLDAAERAADTALKYSPDQERDDHGRWSSGGGGSDVGTSDGEKKPGKGPDGGGAEGGSGGASAPKDVMDRIMAGEQPTVQPGDVSAILAHAKTRSDDPDLTELKVAGTLKFGGDGLGIARIDMPQIPDDKRAQFLQDLAKAGVQVTDEMAKPIDLHPVQKEISSRKVGGILDWMRTSGVGEGRIFVSKDDYVLDGHHRWGAAVALGFEQPDVTMPVSRLGLDHSAALQWMLDWNTQQGIAHSATGKVLWADIEKRYAALKGKKMTALDKVVRDIDATEREADAALKGNPNHDELGRFASGDGGGNAKAPGESRARCLTCNGEVARSTVGHDGGWKHMAGDRAHEPKVSVTAELDHRDARAQQGNWVPGGGGKEEPFVAQSGARLQYLWQPSTGRHAYIDLGTDMILSDEEAARHMGQDVGPGRKKADTLDKYSPDQERDERGRFAGGAPGGPNEVFRDGDETGQFRGYTRAARDYEQGTAKPLSSGERYGKDVQEHWARVRAGQPVELGERAVAAAAAARSTGAFTTHTTGSETWVYRHGDGIAVGIAEEHQGQFYARTPRMSGGSPNRDSTGRPAGPAFGTLQEAVDHLTGKYQPEGMRRTKVDKALKALDDAERAEDMALKEAKGDLAGRFGVGVGRAITHNHGQVTVAHAHPGFAETTGGAGHTHKPLYAEGEKGLSSSGPGRNPAAGENDMTLKYSEDQPRVPAGGPGGGEFGSGSGGGSTATEAPTRVPGAGKPTGGKPVKAGNPMGKTRPESKPYLTVSDPRSGFEWRVLRSYQTNNDKPYARWLCSVSSPYLPAGDREMGDTYVKDIEGTVTQRDPVVTDAAMPRHLK